MNNELRILKVFCIIPAFNEEKNILEVINSVKPYVSEIVVVDDGSDDGTAHIVEASHGAFLLRHIVNRGQGAALETGTRYALMKGADIIVHFDADGQFLAEEIKDMIEPIKRGEADAVFGSRFLEKESGMPLFKKNIIMPLARLANLIFLGVKLTDPQSGFRALSREAAKKIRIKQDGMSHCSEILYKARKENLRVKEIPITVIYHDFGQRFSGGFKILKELFLGRLIH
jgi:glycosyltransferase involved in cell wall biosynthesis